VRGASLGALLGRRGAERLDSDQRRAVTAPAGPLLVLAGAGSGKTRVLTERAAALIARGEVDAGALLCVTFTNRAAEEMRSRLAELLDGRAARRATIGTFHSLCYRMLRQSPQRVGLRPGFSVYDQAEARALVARALAETEAGEELSARVSCQQIGQAKARLLDPDRYRGLRDSERVRRVARAWERYEELLAASNAVDFDDLLVKAVGLLSEPDLLERWQRRFDGVLVDEYQDTNPAQYELVRRLVAAHRNVTAVGDSGQAIYRFRGAEVRNILGFESDFAGARVVKLERNWRSSGAIVATAARLIAHNALRHDTTMRTEADHGPAVVFDRYERVEDEAAAAAAWCRGHIEGGTDAGEVAVLFRTRRQAQALEDALATLAVPYRVVGGRSLYEAAAVRDLVAHLRLLANPSDQGALARALQTRAGVGRRSVALVLGAGAERQDLVDVCARAQGITGLPVPAARSVERFAGALGALRGAGVAAAVEGAVAELEAARGGDADPDRRELLERVARQSRSYEQEAEAPELAEFLAQATLEAGEGPEPRARVTLSTLHGAKGAEWQRVWLAGLCEGLLPHARSPEGEALEEERRLAYVGMTRAKRELVLSFARLDERRRPKRASRFVAEALGEGLAEAA